VHREVTTFFRKGGADSALEIWWKSRGGGEKRGVGKVLIAGKVSQTLGYGHCPQERGKKGKEEETQELR